jgi:hypothetical protein
MSHFFLNENLQCLDNMTSRDMLSYLDDLVEKTTVMEIEEQERKHAEEIEKMKAFMQKAQAEGLLPEDPDADDGSLVLRNKDGSFNALEKKNSEQEQETRRGEEKPKIRKEDEIDPIPDKTRVNRFTVDGYGMPVLDSMPDHVAGYVCDGSEIPMCNEGPHFRADLPDVFQDMRYRNWLLSKKYNVEEDIDVFDTEMSFALVSFIGPVDTSIRCERPMLRIWAIGKNPQTCREISAWICKKTTYGKIFKIGMVPVGQWFTLPLQFSLSDHHPFFNIYMKNYLNEQKRATVELEQRALDEDVRSKNQNRTIAKQFEALQGSHPEEASTSSPSVVPTSVPIPSTDHTPALPSTSTTESLPPADPNVYNPDLDRPKRYDHLKYYVLSCVGPKYGPVSEKQKDPRAAIYFAKIWGACKKLQDCAQISEWANNDTEYGRLHHKGVGIIGEWTTIPPTFSKTATATYSNPQHRMYMESLAEQDKKRSEMMQQKIAPPDQCV